MPAHEARAARLAACCVLALLAGCDRPDSAAMTRTNDQAGEAAVFDYSDQDFLGLVERYAGPDGRDVDYAAWQESADDMARLDRYVAAIGRVSPVSHPQRFASGNAERRYWINAYNALVIDAVLDLWPLDSVRDVRVSLTSRLIPGKGFFYDREVIVGGRRTNLRDLERELLGRQNDRRLHFALNCASDSCPVLRASDWSEADLEQAARDFINDPRNVQVTGDAVRLSRIFTWYRDEFPADILAYLKDYAEPSLADALDRAIGEELPIEYLEYDWSLNAAR